jgi:hypothetical protein
MGEKSIILFAPSEYWTLSQVQRKAICNGCGAGKLLGLVVPDNILGVNITEACDIHDFMYATGKTIGDKYLADRVFLNNMVRLILADKSDDLLLRKRRLDGAQVYYDMVHRFGGPFYWANKNKKENMGVA